jgi:hypothetical protein
LSKKKKNTINEKKYKEEKMSLKEMMVRLLALFLVLITILGLCVSLIDVGVHTDHTDENHEIIVDEHVANTLPQITPPAINRPWQ